MGQHTLLRTILYADCSNIEEINLTYSGADAIDLSNKLLLTSFSMTQTCPNIVSANFDGCTDLATVNMYSLGYGAYFPALTTVGVSGCSAMTSFQITSASNLSSVDVSQFTSPSLTTINITNCGLGETGVDDILAACLILAVNVSGVTFNLTSSGTPSAQGYADKAILQTTYGWTVTTD
jgi:hypothetical protein